MVPGQLWPFQVQFKDVSHPDWSSSAKLEGVKHKEELCEGSLNLFQNSDKQLVLFPCFLSEWLTATAKQQLF